MTEDGGDRRRGIEMDDDEIDEALRELGHGTLALASGNEAYGVPVSFGYDGDRIFINLLKFGDRSKKLAFSEATETATLTAYQTASKFDWRSVVVAGRLVEVDPDDHEYMESVLDDNAWFPNLFAPTEAITEIRRMELDVQERTGRQGPERQ